MTPDESDYKELHVWTIDGAESKPPRSEMLERYMQTLAPGASVLDVGCGEGHLTARLHGRGIKVLGIDINAELVAQAQQRGLPVRLMDAREALRCGSDEYDVLCMLDFIEHIPVEMLIDLLRLARRKPGRVIWLQTPNLDSLMGLKFWFHMPSHVTAINPWVLRRILDRLGFDVVAEWTDWGGIPWRGFRRWITLKIINALFGAPLAKLFIGGGNICMVARARPDVSGG